MPIVTEPPQSVAASSPAVRVAPTPAMIEIRIAGAVVRAAPDTEAAQLTAVLRAVRKSASRT